LFVKSFVPFNSFRDISTGAVGVKVGKADKPSENGIICFGIFSLVKKCCHVADSSFLFCVLYIPCEYAITFSRTDFVVYDGTSTFEN